VWKRKQAEGVQRASRRGKPAKSTAG
jgi:hypothetical protein